MDETTKKASTIDACIETCPPAQRARMQELRAAIRAVVPDATETIAWGMPTFRLGGNLVHFACHARHIGLYPGSEGIAAFEEEFRRRGLEFSKGAVQLPHAAPLPLDLVRRIVEFRAEQQRGRRKPR